MQELIYDNGRYNILMERYIKERVEFSLIILVCYFLLYGFLAHMGYRNCVYDIIINKYDKHKTRY